MKGAWLTVEGLSGAYGTGFSLRDISFSAGEGTLTALLGANGSGKTTLLRAICQQMKHQGSCRLLLGRTEGSMDPERLLPEDAEGNIALEGLSQRALARLVSYVPQRTGITVGMAVLDVVLMGFNPVLGLLERPGRSQRQQAIEALGTLGLGGCEGRDYLTLSEGQKQLVLLARTLIEGSRLLILDEPDSALDLPNRYRILSRIAEQVKGRARAGILSLHDPQLALEFCDQLVLLREGRCLGCVYPASDPLSVTEAALRKIYGPVTVAECRGKAGRKKRVLLWEPEEECR